MIHISPLGVVYTSPTLNLLIQYIKSILPFFFFVFCNSTQRFSNPVGAPGGTERELINCNEYISRKQEEIIDYEREYLVKSNQYPLMIRFYDDLMKEKNEILNVLLCN
jgi:hypothetical protein